MVKKIIVTTVAIMSIISVINGCFSKKPDKKTDAGSTVAEASAALPEGAHITRFFAHRSGSMMEMCYILCEKEDGVYMKKTFDEPYCRDEAYDLDERDSYFYGVDEVFDGEFNAESFKLTDDTPLREIEAVVEEYGALGWDGWKKENKLPAGVMDGDYHVKLYIELSDGTVVDMSGSNASPPRYGDFHYEIEKIFTKTADSYRRETDSEG